MKDCLKTQPFQISKEGKNRKYAQPITKSTEILHKAKIRNKEPLRYQFKILQVIYLKKGAKKTTTTASRDKPNRRQALNNKIPDKFSIEIPKSRTQIS